MAIPLLVDSYGFLSRHQMTSHRGAKTKHRDTRTDGAQARAVLSAAQMQEWSEARVLEWAESVALSADDVEVVKRAFVDDGGVDGDELAHMRPRSLQKLLRSKSQQDFPWPSSHRGFPSGIKCQRELRRC